jgi:hypothetical protein
MIGDIGLGTEQTFFLAGPKRDANGAAGLQMGGFDDARRFHGDGHADAVVGRAGAGLPGVHVAAQHDDLILQIGARNLRDGVVGHRVFVWYLTFKSTSIFTGTPCWSMRTRRL